MNKFSIKLKDGNHAIIQTCGFNKNKEITARIGIILPHTKCIEFLSIEGWEATYKGTSESIKNKLLFVYEKNHMIIHKNLMASIAL